VYIIAGNKDIQDLAKKYIVLELDTIKVGSNNTTTYCVVDSTNVDINDIGALESYKTLHASLIKNYKIGNWKFCNDAIKHLHGKFNGELDTFYDVFKDRVLTLQEDELPKNWTGVVDL
jgi:hypothetical protein